MSKKEPTLSAAQKKFLEVYDKVGGNVSLACQQANIKSRTTYYRWMKEGAFKDEIENINESYIDMAETQLRAAVSRGDMNAVFFLLKTKGKSRGYVEKIEQDVKNDAFYELMKELDAQKAREAREAYDEE